MSTGFEDCRELSEDALGLLECRLLLMILSFTAVPVIARCSLSSGYFERQQRGAQM